MLKSGQKRPTTPNKSKSDASTHDAAAHWRQGVRETVITTGADGGLNFSIRGGSDNGEFAYVCDIYQSKIKYVSGTLQDQDVLLEIQGQKVAGYTQRDVVAWLNHCCRNGNPVVLKTVTSGTITKDLRQFLNTRFQKGSIDHDLQNTIRDNLYLRTVPVTTRSPREGEVNGVDYTFLTLDEFMALERSGNLLESGVYEGNHYGTPKPSREPPVSPPQSSGSNPNLSPAGHIFGGLFPGAHPSSEGKRKRNRSNVEAMASKTMDPEPIEEGMMGEGISNSGEQIPGPPGPGCPPNYLHAGECPESPRGDLGPLPPNWEKAYTERGEVYFIDHNSGTSHWLDPRLSKFQKKSLEECLDDELPYGWEKIDDPHYGTYYIDHVNRRTQYENPVIQAKRAAQGSGNYERPFFTRNPNELRGERIQTTLVKSSRGLGFTIVGGDDTEEEFLQIKSKVPNGPAWLDGKLQTGDVLVYVNDTCVLGFTHHDMVSMFQSIGPNETVSLEVCRGYPLPFDPNDPNTEVVTTVAVNAPDAMSSDTNVYVDRDGNMKGENYNFLDASSEAGNVHNGSDDMVNNSVKSMPDLCNSEKMKGIQRPNSTDAMLSDSPANALSLGDFAESSSGRPEFLTISIVKGAMGFGFTIADSAYGQKVKKILDRQRCKNLMEGDILVDINNINVRNMCHSEVVQVLKDCPRNQEATVMVQRGGIGSPSKGKAKKKEDPSSPRKNVYKEPIAGLYRSKTPTADLYSTQQKEVIPNRPKTPLVDTRGRPKTPTSSQRPWTPSEGGGGSSVGASDNLVIGNTGGNGSGTSVVGEFGTSEISGLGPSQYGKGKSGLRGEGTGNKMAMSQNPGSPMSPYDPYKSSLPYPNVNYPMGGHDPSRSPLSHIGDRMMSVNLQDNPKGEYIRSHSPGNDLDGRMNSGEMDPVQSDGWNKPQGHYDFKSGEHFSGNVPQSPSVYDHGVTDINRSDNRSPSTEYYGQYISSSFFNGYGGSYDQSYGYGYGEVQGGGGYPPHKDYGFAAQGSGCNPMSPNLLGGSIPPSSSGYYTSDSLSRRKESTSFEHEQPYPSAVIRYSRDPRWPDSGPVIGMGGAAVVSSPDTGASTGNHIMPSEWYETVVTLVRQETGFGFRIVGGTEEGSQVGPMVSIGHIVPGGAADVDGRLCTGDEIVSVDGQSVLTTSHHHVVQLMGHAASNGQVTLGIRRRVIPSNEGPSYPRQDIGYPYDVSVTRQENEGFGFVIISSVNKAGSTIGRIIEGSPAERCGQLHVGDRILAVNHIDIMNLHHGDIVNLIKDSGYSVTLSIGPPLDDTSSTASASQREEEANVEEEHYHAVELGRGIRGFGFSIRGGREYQNMPLFVLQIAENGPAAVDGRLKIGDQIIEINGINTKNMTHAEAIEIIRNGGPSVRLLVRRCGKVPPPALDHQAIPSSCAASPQSSGLRPGSSLSQPGTGVLGMGQVALPSGSGANSNGPLSHSSSCEPGYWDRYAQS
ncbi:membrane-associated guanylate kinase, WW and PDZ domain-containing protein 2-like isoform X5 [Ischnura elegans]|uniref:membrane-associated guanylate kinase, WW and PDZ domain-containing protein 2-like isoform X5 n=1 Tax=Ischnura elegans TaxID=197161 RepID=UPI001ED87D23|nr:membrane-associated guanylate kinase, WW and PDZ domain-containing protein 2-like isoform X5 [Ischnura elegans]